MKTKTFEYDEIFAIKQKGGKEIIFYKKIGEEDLSAGEMKQFISGEYKALAEYKPRIISLVNYLLSSGITYFAGIHGVLFYAPLAVMIPVVIFAYPTPNVEGNFSGIFIDGYRTAAKHKKIKCLIKSALAGIVTGGAASFIVFKVL
jgi:hypothetical protein